MSRDTKLKAAIAGLAEGKSGADGRTATARVRAALPEIEMALAAGVRHAAILQELRRHGVKLSEAGYMSALARARRANEKSPAITPQPPRAVVSAQNRPTTVRAEPGKAGTAAASPTPSTANVMTFEFDSKTFQIEFGEDGAPQIHPRHIRMLQKNPDIAAAVWKRVQRFPTDTDERYQMRMAIAGDVVYTELTERQARRAPPPKE